MLFSVVHLLEALNSDGIHFLISLDWYIATEYIDFFYPFCSKIEVILAGRVYVGSVGVSISHSSVRC